MTQSKVHQGAAVVQTCGALLWAGHPWCLCHAGGLRLCRSPSEWGSKHKTLRNSLCILWEGPMGINQPRKTWWDRQLSLLSVHSKILPKKWDYKFKYKCIGIKIIYRYVYRNTQFCIYMFVYLCKNTISRVLIEMSTNWFKLTSEHTGEPAQ